MNSENLSIINKIDIHTSNIKKLKFSNDGKQFISLSDQRLVIHDFDTLSIIYSLDLDIARGTSKYLEFS